MNGVPAPNEAFHDREQPVQVPLPVDGEEPRWEASSALLERRAEQPERQVDRIRVTAAAQVNRPGGGDDRPEPQRVVVDRAHGPIGGDERRPSVGGHRPARPGATEIEPRRPDGEPLVVDHSQRSAVIDNDVLGAEVAMDERLLRALRVEAANGLDQPPNLVVAQQPRVPAIREVADRRIDECRSSRPRPTSPRPSSMEPAEQPGGLSEPSSSSGSSSSETPSIHSSTSVRPSHASTAEYGRVEQLPEPDELAHGLGALEVSRLDHTAIVEVDAERHAVELSRRGRRQHGDGGGLSAEPAERCNSSSPDDRRP